MVIDLGEAIERRIQALAGGYRPGIFGGYRPWYAPRDLSDKDEGERRIEIAVLLKARDALCSRCANDDGPHGCPAFRVRTMIAELDPEKSGLSPKDWMPRRFQGKGGESE